MLYTGAMINLNHGNGMLVTAMMQINSQPICKCYNSKVELNVDCPHATGANCKSAYIEWDGVYANPNWWTAGDSSDTYYKCHTKSSYLGGTSGIF